MSVPRFRTHMRSFQQHSRRPVAPLPVVSILTPTYNRATFLRVLADIISHQTYPLHRIEWIVVDDSDRSIGAWFEHLALRRYLKRLLYVHFEEKMPIGMKRNICKALSAGEYCIHMDDDDYYAPTYVHHVVQLFRRHRRFDVIGATEIFFIFPHTPNLFRSGPFHPTHTCGGAMSYTRRFARNNMFSNAAKSSEERTILNNFRVPILQLRHSYNLCIALAHDSNTVSKDRMRRAPTHLLWVNYVHNAALYTYLRMYTKHWPLLMRSSPQNYDGQCKVRLHVVHILVNVAQVAAHLLVDAVIYHRNLTTAAVSIYPRCVAPPQFDAVGDARRCVSAASCTITRTLEPGQRIILARFAAIAARLRESEKNKEAQGN